MTSVLIVEDEAPVRSLIAAILKDARIPFACAKTADDALDNLRAENFDAVLSDIRMPGLSGIELVGEVRAIGQDVPIILMTGYASIDSAVESMRAGAFDYITKPFKRDELLLSLQRAFEYGALARENRRLRAAADRTASMGELIGSSPAMREIYSIIRKIADNPSNVLITGESGTGKDLVARTIHLSSARAERAFVPVNCTAIPEGLLESELFGHTKGAFTGAVRRKIGLVEAANGGTLFLDEIGDMGLGLQSKLLRVLQERSVRPVGGIEAREVDVRVIAATQRDLRLALEQEHFRKDLYYRLNVIPIHLPPLRERPDDIRDLAEHILSEIPDGSKKRITPEAMDCLQRMRFEGNVRELENVIQRAIALGEGDEIGLEDLPLAQSGSTAVAADPEGFFRMVVRRRMRLREIEDQIIDETLRATSGNKVEAARILGISRRTLYRRRAGGPPEPSRQPRE